MGPNTTFWVISRRFDTFCGIWRCFEIFDFFDFLVAQNTVRGPLAAKLDTRWDPCLTAQEVTVGLEICQLILHLKRRGGLRG